MSELSRLALKRDRASCARARFDASTISQRSQRVKRAKLIGKLHFRGTHNTIAAELASGNSATIALHGKCRARLSRAWAFGQNLERRRIATNPPGRATWIKFARRALCAGRTDHWFASARQFAAARYAGRASQKGKFARHRRARRGNDAPCRSHCRSWPARGNARW